MTKTLAEKLTMDEKIRRYLKGKGWVRGYELQKAFYYGTCPESVTRIARYMVRGEVLERRKVDGYVEFRLREA